MAVLRSDAGVLGAAGNGRGILAILVAMAALVVNDVLIKLVARDLATGEIIAIRGGFATLIIVLIAWRQGALPNRRLLRERVISYRLVGEIGSTALFLSALFHMPIGLVTAIMQVVPLAVTAGAAAFLGERVGWRRWIAAGAGFVGVLAIIRPGTVAFTPWALVAIAAVVFVALRDLATRRIPADIASLQVTVLTAASVTLLGLAMSPLEVWVVPTGLQLAKLAGASVLLLSAYFLMIVAMRVAEVSVVAPFRYSIVIWALAMGYVVWGEVPDMAAIMGTTLVTGAGLYVFWRERALA